MCHLLPVRWWPGECVVVVVGFDDVHSVHSIYSRHVSGQELWAADVAEAVSAAAAGCRSKAPESGGGSRAQHPHSQPWSSRL